MLGAHRHKWKWVKLCKRSEILGERMTRVFFLTDFSTIFSVKKLNIALSY